MASTIKQLASLATRAPGFSVFVTLLQRMDRRCPNLLRVLTYHRIGHFDDDRGLGSRLISATPGDFEKQMNYLATNYRAVSVQEVLAANNGDFVLPPRAILVTFDDAYRDFAEYAWPIMRSYRVPVTLFVATAYPDKPAEQTFWWDRLQHGLWATPRRTALKTPFGPYPLKTAVQRDRACRRLHGVIKTLSHDHAMDLVDRICRELDAPAVENLVLGWDELRQLASQGVTLGAHSRTHPLLDRVPLEEARAEAIGSLDDLRKQIGPPSPIFAYPAGALNGDVVNLLKQEGFAMAFTTNRGTNRIPTAHPLEVRRNHIGALTTLQVFQTRLLTRPSKVC